ncbi:unnamed protein product [Ceratitis capitata]|uniref:(Mediterranean fruit fly) hypothetical protein n=1 Tax=Ceratitis capitata TaxID=7213 RepID=A0A811UI48_CERCA|nr:unnamed protein product [Ceratitis capitata]
MPDTRSTSKSSVKGGENEWSDDLNTTIQHQPVEVVKQQSLEMKELQAELRQSQQQQHGVERVNGTLAGVLSDLSRTLADTRVGQEQQSELPYKHRHLSIKRYDGAVPESLIGLDNAHLHERVFGNTYKAWLD